MNGQWCSHGDFKQKVRLARLLAPPFVRLNCKSYLGIPTPLLFLTLGQLRPSAFVQSHKPRFPLGSGTADNGTRLSMCVSVS